jgi:hypothetical protein
MSDLYEFLNLCGLAVNICGPAGFMNGLGGVQMSAKGWTPEGGKRVDLATGLVAGC